MAYRNGIGDDDSARVAPAVLEHELQLIADAVATVASGAAPRITVAGLRFGDELVETARDLAARAGVRLTPLWRTDESGLDLVVEAMPPEGAR